MMAPELDLLGIFVPTPALAIAIAFIVLFILRRVLDTWLHDCPFGGRIWQVGFIQVCIYLIFLGGLMWLFGGPNTAPLSVGLYEWIQRLTGSLT